MLRRFLALGLVFFGAVSWLALGRATERGESPLDSCVIMPGLWVSPDGTPMLRVHPNGNSILAPGFPWGACGSYPMSDVFITGPPCAYELTVACRAQIEIIFVTSVSAILSARLIGPAGACTDTCQAWMALPLHPVSVGISARPWSFLKSLFRE